MTSPSIHSPIPLRSIATRAFLVLSLSWSTVATAQPDVDVAQLLRMADERLTAGDLAASLTAARLASTIDSVRGNLSAARTLAAVGAWPAAESAVLEAQRASDEPLDPAGARLLARIYLEQDKADAAMATLHTASQTHPDNSDIANELALRLLDSGKAEDAYDVLARHTQRDSGVWGLVLAALPEHRDAAIKVLRQSLEASGSAPTRVTLVPDQELHAQLGGLLTTSGQAELSEAQLLQGVEHLERAFELGPKNADLAYRLSQLYRQLGKTEKATTMIAEFQRLRAKEDAADAARRSTGVELNAVQELAANNQLEAAVERVEAILEHQPNSYSAHALHAKLLFSLGQSEPALAAIRKAIDLRPGLVEFHYLEGFFARTAGRDQEARAALERAVALDPNLAEAHAILGGILLQEGDAQGSLHHLDRAIALGAGGDQIERARTLALERIGQ